MNWLEHDIKRLKCSTNKDGFIPGQAAGFCLLSTPDTARRWKLDFMATVLAEAAAEEENPFSSGKLSTGKGLTQSLAQVLKEIPRERQIDQIYSSFNGEGYNAQDFSYAVLNTGSQLGDFGTCIAPHDCWGDIGAASVPVLISLATEAGKKGYAKGALNLIIASSLGSSRGCVLLELNTE